MLFFLLLTLKSQKRILAPKRQISSLAKRLMGTLSDYLRLFGWNSFIILLIYGAHNPINLVVFL